MEIHSHKKGGLNVLVPEGEIDFHVSPILRQHILAALDEDANLLIDMSRVSYIDSSGIACLVEGLQHARGRKLKFGLAAVQASALQVLKLTRLDTVFPIHDSVEAGLEG